METKDIGGEKGFTADSYSFSQNNISELIEWLQYMDNKGATHVHFSATGFPDGTTDEIQIQCYKICQG